MRTRGDMESDVIKTIRTAQQVRSRRRLPIPNSESPNGGEIANTPQGLLKESEQKNDVRKQLEKVKDEHADTLLELKIAERQLSHKNKLIARLNERLAMSSGAKEAAIHAEIKGLLEERCKELENQLRQIELENAVLLRRVCESEKMAEEYHERLATLVDQSHQRASHIDAEGATNNVRIAGLYIKKK